MEVVETDRQQCPYCKEEIAFGARKCKHCGEWLDARVSTNIKPQIDAKNKTTWVDKIEEMGLGGFVAFLFAAGVGWLLYYFGSWQLLFNTKFSDIKVFWSSGGLIDEDVIVKKEAIALRINDGFYGFANDGRFFDLPILQYIMLFIAICAFYEAIRTLFFGARK